MKRKTVKLLDENLGGNLHAPGSGRIPRHETKSRADLHFTSSKLKTFALSDTVKRMKKQLEDWRTYLQITYPVKGVETKYIRNSQNSLVGKLTAQLKMVKRRAVHQRG